MVIGIESYCRRCGQSWVVVVTDYWLGEAEVHYYYYLKWGGENELSLGSVNGNSIKWNDHFNASADPLRVLLLVDCVLNANL